MPPALSLSAAARGQACPPHFLLALSHLSTNANAWLLQGCGRVEGSPCCPPSSAGAGDYWCAAGLTCKGAVGVDPSYPSFLRLQSEREGEMQCWEVQWMPGKVPQNAV